MPAAYGAVSRVSPVDVASGLGAVDRRHPLSSGLGHPFAHRAGVAFHAAVPAGSCNGNRGGQQARCPFAVAGLVAIGEQARPRRLRQRDEERRLHRFVERERLREPLLGLVVTVEGVGEQSEVVATPPWTVMWVVANWSCHGNSRSYNTVDAGRWPLRAAAPAQSTWATSHVASANTGKSLATSVSRS